MKRWFAWALGAAALAVVIALVGPATQRWADRNAREAARPHEPDRRGARPDRTDATLGGGSRQANAPPHTENVLGRQDPLGDALDSDADGWPDTAPGALRPGQFQETVGALIRDDPRYTLIGVDCTAYPCVAILEIDHDSPEAFDASSREIARKLGMSTYGATFASLKISVTVSRGTSPERDRSGDRVQLAFAVVSADEVARLEEAQARLDAVGRDLADHMGTELLEAHLLQRRSDRPHQDP